MAKREKQVFDTHEIAHLWAHAAQLSARNPQGNFSFAGSDLRSYSTTIAKRITHKKQTVFLLLDQTWSSTTNTHQCEMRRAVYGTNVFRVCELPCATYDGAPKEYKRADKSTHKANVVHMLKRAETSAAKSSRARSNAEYLASQAAQWHTEAIAYAKLFGIRMKLPPLDVEALASAAKEREAKASAAQRRATTERTKRQAEIKTQRAQYMPAAIQNWRNTGAYTFQPIPEIYIDAHQLAAFHGSNLMRLDGDIVVTDLGARVPAPIVRRMVRTVLTAMNAILARAPHPGAIDPDPDLTFTGKHIGPFIINGVYADKVIVGCHKFNRDEVSLIADTLERAEIVPAEDSTAV